MSFFKFFLIIKDTWTITKGDGNGRGVGRAGVVGRGGGEGWWGKAENCT